MTEHGWWEAHVPCTSDQHDPANGLIYGFCVRCRTPWPCPWSPESDEQAEVARLSALNERLAKAGEEYLKMLDWMREEHGGDEIADRYLDPTESALRAAIAAARQEQEDSR